MTAPDVPATAQEAREAAFADWWVLQDADQVDAHAGWDAAWAAALEWTASLAQDFNAMYAKACLREDCRNEIHYVHFASLLRQEGGDATRWPPFTHPSELRPKADGSMPGAPYMPGCEPTEGGTCCDLHGRNCEPPSELCCENCTELDHPDHTQLRPCSNPDLSAGLRQEGGGT